MRESDMPRGAPSSYGRDAGQHWKAEALRFQEVHDRSPDGMMIFGAIRGADAAITDFEWLYSNPSASRIVGRRAEDLRGKRLLAEMPGNKDAGLFDIYVGVVEQGEPHSHEFAYRHEGLDSWFRATSIKMGDGFYVAFSDLTVRKRAEDQAARLAAIVRSSAHAIFSESREGIVETWNSGAELLYGYTSAEIVGQPTILIVPPDRRAEREASVQQAFERGGVEQLETVRVTKAGARVRISVTFSPIRDTAGRSTGMAVIARDISGEMKLQERLVVADRMSSVGTLAAGVAHEINNPLATVTANIELLIEELRTLGGGSPSARLRDLEAMAVSARDAADRVRKIVRGLKTFSQADEEQRAPVDLRQALELAIKLAFNEVRQRARLVRTYGETPLVLADEARLGQVFLNLLVNAGQAIAEGNVAENEIRITTSTDDAGWAVVEVEDTGSGIPSSVMARMFDPFFTTKDVGVGVGLGLAICRNIVTQMGGQISARNRDVRGATFRVLLPGYARPTPEHPAAPVVAAAILRRAAVLVVDDDAAVGIVVARVLRDHDVTVVTKATMALELLAQGQQFDVILSDLMMPEMSGMDLHAELARRYPEDAERVVFITGGASTSAAQAFLQRVTNERVEKPFEAGTMRALIQRLVK